ncbi:hypothetical protein VdG1_02343 [Verticillium dahliae VDG1]|nr:hypothetical protein VdG1_02343 [Verticillium dahliae VDG1]
MAKGVALKFLQWFIRGVQFGCAAIVLGIFSYFLATLSNHNIHIATHVRAVTGISGAAVLYAILGLGTDGFTNLPSFRQACRLQTACFAVAIVAIVFFLLSILVEVFLTHTHDAAYAQPLPQQTAGVHAGQTNPYRYEDGTFDRR